MLFELLIVKAQGRESAPPVILDVSECNYK